MASKKTHYGDEDPEYREEDEDSPEFEEEQFKIAKSMGWTPEDLRDKAFAEKYRKWLEQAN